MIYWTASNNSSFLNGYRTAKTLLGAIRTARAYVDGELYGEGCIKFYKQRPEYGSEPFRIDEKSIFTDFKWYVDYR